MMRKLTRRRKLILGVSAIALLAVLFGFGVNPLYIGGRGWLPPFCYAMLGLPHVQPTPEAIADAKRHPGGIVYEIDGRYDRNGTVPPQAIKGTWKVDEDGNITGDFMPSPWYVPGHLMAKRPPRQPPPDP